MGPKPCAEEDELQLLLLHLAHSRTDLTTVSFCAEIGVGEDEPSPSFVVPH